MWSWDDGIGRRVGHASLPAPAHLAHRRLRWTIEANGRDVHRSFAVAAYRGPIPPCRLRGSLR